MLLLVPGCSGAPEESAPPLSEVSLPGDLESQDVPVQRQFQHAEERLSELRADPDATDAELAEGYGRLGMLLHTYAYPDQAAVAYRNASRLAPDDARWWYYLGHVSRALGDDAVAINVWGRVLELDPDHRAARAELAAVLADVGRREEATARFEQLVEDRPADAGALLGLGRARQEAGDTEAAIELLERALAQRPGSAPVLYALGLAYRDAGDRERARELLAAVPEGNLLQDRELYDDPWLDDLDGLRTGGRVHELRGIRALDTGRLAAAVVEFRQAMAADPTRTYALYTMGLALNGLGRHGEAEASFRRLLELSPQHAPTHLALARTLAKTGRTEEAREHLQESLEIDPSSAEAHLLSGHLARQTGRHGEAVAAYERVARLDPSQGDLAFWTSASLFLDGRVEEAIVTVRDATFATGGVRAQVLLARELAAAPPLHRDLEKALALAGAAWSAAPSATTAATRAFVLAHAGRMDEAIAWQTAVVEAAAGEPPEWTAQRLAAYRRGEADGVPWRADETWAAELVAPPTDRVR